MGPRSCLFISLFEPRDFYKKNYYKKTSVWQGFRFTSCTFTQTLRAFLWFQNSLGVCDYLLISSFTGKLKILFWVLRPIIFNVDFRWDFQCKTEYFTLILSIVWSGREFFRQEFGPQLLQNFWMLSRKHWQKLS